MLFSKIVSAVARLDLVVAVFAICAWGFTDQRDVSSTMFWCGAYALAALPLLVIASHTLRFVQYVRGVRVFAEPSELTVKP